MAVGLIELRRRCDGRSSAPEEAPKNALQFENLSARIHSSPLQS